MEQEKALNALAGTLALMNSASSPRMAADLILAATSTPGAYVFSELLYHPNVQSLASQPEYAPQLEHLCIFAHGTYQDYVSRPSDALPPLNEAQKLKLRRLSLLSLAGSSDRSKDKAASPFASSSLGYNSLQVALGLGTARELEELVIGATYANLLRATLDPARQVVGVTSVSPLRDVAPGSIPIARQTLGAWSTRCDVTLEMLESEMRAIRDKAAARSQEKERAAAAVEKLIAVEKLAAAEKSDLDGGSVGRKAKRGAALGGAEEDDGAMDLDDDDDGGEKKRGRRKF